MRHISAPAALADRHEAIETPEHVALGYELADLGSRFAALLADVILIGIVLVGIVLGGSFLLRPFQGLPALAGWGLALVLLTAFGLVWGYFIYFEGLRDGQTPGKRALGIRAVHDGGYPLTVRGAAIRNLLRLIDIQPAPSWLVGGLFMMLHSQTKRVGDIAAGSIVVRERVAPVLPELGPVAAAAGPPRLGEAEMAALERYIVRRRALRPEVRVRIAAQLLDVVRASIPKAAPRAGTDTDAVLIALHREEIARHAAAGGAGAAGSPQAAALVRRQQRVWSEYRELLEVARRSGLARLSERRLARFAALYRETAADLARARTYGASETVVYTLERWVGAGHNFLYRPTRHSWRVLRGWFTRGFPALVRRRWRPIAFAGVLLYLPALISFAAVRREPIRAFDLLPSVMTARAEAAPEREAAGQQYVEISDVFLPVMASGIIANNVQVTFAAFAGGIVLGLGTVFVLVFNGVHLGAVGAAFANHGASMHLWSFVLPHGVVELTAICIAGGAGLWIAAALLLPGRRTRHDALVIHAREAVSLLSGAVFLLVLAGVIEAFVSPAAIPRAAKFAFAGAVLLLLVAYLATAGERSPDAEALTPDPGARLR